MAGAEGSLPISDTQPGRMRAIRKSMSEHVENRAMEAVAVVVEEVHFGECAAVDGNLQHAGVHSGDAIHGEHRSNK